jgi:hypothetical protein
MLVCHLCKKDLDRKHIVYQDYEANRMFHYHEQCANKVKEAVINEYFNLMFRVANHKLLPRKDDK